MGLLPIISDPAVLLARRVTQSDTSVTQKVSDILNRVRVGGDAALNLLTTEFDAVTPGQLKVSSALIADSEANMSASLRTAFEEAGNNIRRFSQKQLPQSFKIEQPDTTFTSWNWRPIPRVGVYIPGGRYPLASSLLMTAIPAQVAGVSEIVVCTPPQMDGQPDPTILGLCAMLGITEIFAVGGAQAVAAMAYGTESIRPVQKIAGPGNAYVAEAKAQLSRTVAIDMPAGPTEIVVLADQSANPEWVAIDLISQAEHDPDAVAVLVTTELELAEAVNSALEKLLPVVDTETVARASLLSHGTIYLATDLDDSLRIINTMAPEHLSLQIVDASAIAERCVAGAIFIGNSTPVAWGDYWAGPNHTLPTSGWAISHGPLSVIDFMTPYSVIEAPKIALRSSASRVIEMAQSEGLIGHSRSVTARLNDE